jgi:hypothetical protein
MKNYVLLFMITFFLHACSNESIHEEDLITFNSFEELQAYANRLVLRTDTTSYDSFSTYIEEKDKVQLRATIHYNTVKGYHALSPHEGCTNLEIKVTSFQDAQKLGIVPNQKYYLTINKVQYLFPLQSNWRPGIGNSPFCGLVLNNPRNDDFVNAIRGYGGNYFSTELIYRMTTSILKFEINGDDSNPIWYPCKPDETIWNIAVIIL